MMEKSIEEMNASELRAEMSRYHLAAKPQLQEPLYPGSDGSEPDDVRALYVEALLKKDASKLSPAERDYLRAAAHFAAKTLGY
jgi:hypothetical protein